MIGAVDDMDYVRVGDAPNEASVEALFRWLSRGGGPASDNAEREMQAQFHATDVRRRFERLTSLSQASEIVSNALRLAIRESVIPRARQLVAAGVEPMDETAERAFWLKINWWVAPNARVSEDAVAEYVREAIDSGAREGRTLREARRTLAMADAVIAGRSREHGVVSQLLHEFATALINKRDEALRSEGGARASRE